MLLTFNSLSRRWFSFVLLPAAIVLFGSSAPAAARQLSIAAAGAVGDGTTLDTVAIQQAIDTLAAKGGGTLVIPKGTFLSGAIYLKPGVNLHLARGAVLKGSTNIADYPELMTRIEGHFQVWIPALVNASNVNHLRITGPGTISGGGQFYWDEFWRARRKNPFVTNVAVKRPRNLFIEDCKHVEISGIALRDSGFWNLHLFRCSDVLVKNVDIRAPLRSPSTDGMDIDSCQRVTVKGAYISVNDDNICLKGNKGTAALDDKSIPPVEHVRISGCTFGLGNAALTVGSEATTVRDVIIENCRLVGTNRNCVLKLKLRPDTEEHYENITARNLRVENPNTELVSILPWRQFFDLRGRPAPSQWVTNVTLENITGTLHDFGQMVGPAKGELSDLTFKNINITVQTNLMVLRNVKHVKFTKVKINGAPFTGEPATAAPPEPPAEPPAEWR